MIKAKNSMAQMIVVFAAVNLIASHINHIDDTDEPFGYWEPLHYLLNGDGMQTWEYDPQYSIRTYAFIYPMWCAAVALKYIGTPKVTTFYVLRSLLGLLTAYAQGVFASSVEYRFGQSLSRLCVLFMLSSPGVFYASTSYLPSAVVMGLVMLSFASWMKRSYLSAIFYGCLSVLWSGWPFVALLFIPLGVHMLWSTFIEAAEGRKWTRLMQLCLAGVGILVTVLVSAAAIDMYAYQRMTSPTWNILLYNAIGGSGDELYGVEPTSYYIRNLFLNLGLAWPLGIAAPVLLLRNILQGEYSSSASIVKNQSEIYHHSNTRQDHKESSIASEGQVAGTKKERRHHQPQCFPFNPEEERKRPVVDLMTMFAPAVMWLLVLFRRPHKEERFVYPIYPLLAFMAAFSLTAVVDIIGGLIAAILREAPPPKYSTTTLIPLAPSVVAENGEDGGTSGLLTSLPPAEAVSGAGGGDGNVTVSTTLNEESSNSHNTNVAKAKSAAVKQVIARKVSREDVLQGSGKGSALSQSSQVQTQIPVVKPNKATNNKDKLKTKDKATIGKSLATEEASCDSTGTSGTVDEQTTAGATGEDLSRRLTSTTSSSATRASSSSSSSSWGYFSKQVLVGACLSLSMLLFLARVMANHTNYSGYIDLWKDVNDRLLSSSLEPSNDSNREYYSSQHSDRTKTTPIRVCTGGEWYSFPSHFFLPDNARLEFVYDTFHGELPQHFAPINGTFTTPLQPFNDGNREEMSRYIPLEECDYVVAVTNPDDYDVNSGGDHEYEEEVGGGGGGDRGPLATAIYNNLLPVDANVDDFMTTASDTSNTATAGSSPLSSSLRGGNDESSASASSSRTNVIRFKKLSSRPVIDPSRSRSALARAYSIPGLSRMKNKYNEYTLYQVVAGTVTKQLQHDSLSSRNEVMVGEHTVKVEAEAEIEAAIEEVEVEAEIEIEMGSEAEIEEVVVKVE